MNARYCRLCREERLDETPMRDMCAACDGPACATHDRCFGCAEVVCRACDTVSPFGAPFWFVGDSVAHPHCEEDAA